MRLVLPLRLIVILADCCLQVMETEAYTKRWWLPYALVAYNVAFTAVYILLPEYFVFFVLTFIVLCIVVVAKSVALYRLAIPFSNRTDSPHPA